MQRSKTVALLVVLAALIAGAALGFTADRLMSRRGHGRADRPSRDAIARELNLTTAQRAQFDSIMNSRRAQMREVFKPIRPQMDSLQKVAKVIGDSTHEQLKRILTPEQGAKLDQMRDRNRKREESRRHNDGEKGRPQPIP